MGSYPLLSKLNLEIPKIFYTLIINRKCELINHYVSNILPSEANSCTMHSKISSRLLVQLNGKPIFSCTVYSSCLLWEADDTSQNTSEVLIELLDGMELYSCC